MYLLVVLNYTRQSVRFCKWSWFRTRTVVTLWNGAVLLLLWFGHPRWRFALSGWFPLLWSTWYSVCVQHIGRLPAFI